MSRKIQQFTSFIAQPLNIHNFFVDIPALGQYGIVVQSTSFPGEQMRTTPLYVQGEEVRYGTVPQNSGNWAINIPEGDSGTTRKLLEGLKSRSWNQQAGTVNTSSLDWFDITVTARDLNSEPVFQVILHGSWIVGRNDVPLNQQDPQANWKWDYMFRYQWPEDVALR